MPSIAWIFPMRNIYPYSVYSILGTTQFLVQQHFILNLLETLIISSNMHYIELSGLQPIKDLEVMH